jgi:hypothetical protein
MISYWQLACRWQKQAQYLFMPGASCAGQAALLQFDLFCRTESCAVSSWKADSDDSEFIDSRASRCTNGPGGMLLTGPHGSGKSAAVHAAAQVLIAPSMHCSLYVNCGSPQNKHVLMPVCFFALAQLSDQIN